MTREMAGDIPGLILEGPPKKPVKQMSPDPAHWAENTAWLGNAARSGVADQMADIVQALPEFKGFDKMLDLGGSHGIYCITMVGRHPAMTGTVFDFAPVVETAETFIREYGLEKRIGVLAGDFNRDDIGRGYDFIWACSSLNFARHNMDRVMGKIYNALNPGGIFMNFSEGLTREGTFPDLFTLYKVAMAMNQPMAPFEQGVIAGAVLKAGFRQVRSQTLETAWGIKDLDIAKK